MDASIYRLMAATQRDHWWFAARRVILGAVLRRLPLPSPARVLEVGCGTGGNLRMLAGFGPVKAMEMDEYAVEFARALGIAEVRSGWLPEALPYGGADRFDLICLFDVLEHCQDDRASLAALVPLLAPGGFIVVTAPAYQWLFGEHDRAHHHFRRYTASRLKRVARAAGFDVDRSGYFNTILFPVVALHRALAKIGIGKAEDDARMPAAAVNRMLSSVFACERFVVPRIAFPFGTSVIAVLSRGRPGDRGP